MNELKKILEILGTLNVSGWENIEKLVYIKLIIEKMIKEAGEKHGE